MRLSTGIILSILSTNVFAIKHLNGAHPSSLLARRAVVADADGHLLQKRTNGQDDEDQEDQEEQVKPKVSVPNPDSSQAGPVYDNLVSEDDFNPDPNSNLDTGEGSTDSVAYDPDQDSGATGGNKDVHTSLVPNQERPSFADAFRESSSRVFGRIRQGLSRKKHEFELSFSSKHQISAVSKAVKSHFDGEKGDEIDLQDGLQQSIENHISNINTAIKYIRKTPKSMTVWLEMLMETADDFYRSILDAKSEYSDLSKDLGQSDGGHIEELDRHIDAVETYRQRLFDRFNNIVKIVENHRKPQKQKSTSKSLLSSIRFKKRPGIAAKSSEDEASSSTQSNDGASGGSQ
ncbi:hypothetical protein BASA60_005960 [Batrachochytrium salamandrivorans]|nr:hypothetical protein BASA60_005960 [Batrachochytrium salamandrivorans]